MRVEVVYSLPAVQDLVTLDLPEGSVASQALEASGMCERHGLPLGKLRLAIFGKAVAHGQRLRAGDRVEILRTLAADPNSARRRRARRPTRV